MITLLLLSIVLSSVFAIALACFFIVLDIAAAYFVIYGIWALFKKITKGKQK